MEKFFPQKLCRQIFVEKSDENKDEDTHNYVIGLYNGRNVVCEARDKPEETADELKIRIEADKCPV